MRKNTKTIAVIGGGPAGLAAAIAAKKTNLQAEVVILEAADNAGKSILKTGNGRCNFSNKAASFPTKNSYRNADFVKNVQKSVVKKIAENKIFHSEEEQTSLQFFEDCGLVWTTESNGMMFPYSNQAKTVQQVLLKKATELDIKFKTGSTVQQIDTTDSTFKIFLENKLIFANKLIVASGGGTAGLFKDAIKTTGTSKVLGPIKTKEHIPNECDGVRARAKVSLNANGNIFFEEKGQVLFRKYGVSGIVIFNASRFLEPNTGQKLVLDLAPNIAEPELTAYFNRNYHKDDIKQTLLGFLPVQLNRLISRKAPEKITPALLAHSVKNICLTAQTIGESKQCQVTRGGVEVSQINQNSMQINKIPGLYVAGEIVDVDGACGGFNLDWAWTSGILAGMSAAE